MSWIMVGSAAVSVVGGAIANNQKNKATQGAANSIRDSQQQQYEQTRQDLSPYRDFGAGALPLLGQLNSGDYSGFLDSPDYLAALNQGQGQIDHSAAARGGLFGGGHTRDSIAFGSGLASQYLGNYRNSLFNQAQMGQSAAAQLGQFGQNAANQIGGAQADYYQQRGDNNSQFTAGTAGALGGLFNNYMASRAPTARQSSYAQPQLGNNYANFGNWGY